MAEGKIYIPRVVTSELEELLDALPAIAIEGPRGCGKTATALRLAASTFRLDDAAQRQLVEASPSTVIGASPTVLIDEWQRVPETWDVVRRAVDDDMTPGRFLLTGSQAPTRRPTHSGAGRIVTVRMRPLGLSERGLAAPTVSFGALLSGRRPAVEGASTTQLEDYVREIVRTGFPGLRHLNGRPLRAALDSYVQRIVDVDFQQLDQPVRNPAVLTRWIAAYAAATAMTTSYETIRDAATSGEGDKPAKSTTLPYRDVLERLWLIEPVPAWLPTRNVLSRLAKSPKHHLTDPGLAARLVGADDGALLSGADVGPRVPRDGLLLGHLFESLVTLTVRVLAQAHEARVFHLRTHDARQEIDLIVERADRRVLAIEVKLGQKIEDKDVRHLHWLERKIGDDLLDKVIVSTGPNAYRRKDGVAVIPASLLGV